MSDRNDADIVHHKAQSMGRTAAPETFVRRYTFVEIAALGASTTGFIDPAGFPTNVRVIDVTTRIPTAFAGTTTLVVDVGNAANTNALAQAVDLQVVEAVGTHQPADGVYTPLVTHETAYAPRVTFTSTVENLDQASAGAVEIVWSYFGAKPAPLRGTGDETVIANG